MLNSVSLILAYHCVLVIRKTSDKKTKLITFCRISTNYQFLFHLTLVCWPIFDLHKSVLSQCDEGSIQEAEWSLFLAQIVLVLQLLLIRYPFSFSAQFPLYWWPKMNKKPKKSAPKKWHSFAEMAKVTYVWRFYRKFTLTLLPLLLFANDCYKYHHINKGFNSIFVVFHFY